MSGQWEVLSEPYQLNYSPGKRLIGRLVAIGQGNKKNLFIDCRQYFVDDAGDVRPTKKGFVIPIDLADDFFEMASAIKQAVYEL